MLASTCGPPCRSALGRVRVCFDRARGVQLVGDRAQGPLPPRVPPAGGRAVAGGTAYFAEQPETPPDYIFPLVSGQYFTVENTADFQTLVYEPLYWFGDKNSTSVDYRLSIGNAPVYGDDDRVVTITLKHYRGRTASR